MSTKPRTIDQVRADLDMRGKTIRALAREHGLSERIVYELLRGRFKGRRGQAHKAAVLLGLKTGSHRMTTYTLEQVANALAVGKDAAKKRAARESWTYIEESCRGGRRR